MSIKIKKGICLLITGLVLSSCSSLARDIMPKLYLEVAGLERLDCSQIRQQLFAKAEELSRFSKTQTQIVLQEIEDGFAAGFGVFAGVAGGVVGGTVGEFTGLTPISDYPLDSSLDLFDSIDAPSATTGKDFKKKNKNEIARLKGELLAVNYYAEAVCGS